MFTKSKALVVLVLLTTVGITSAQTNSRSIFSKATDQLLTHQMELSLEIKETQRNGKEKLKAIQVIRTKFGTIEKTKTIIEKPTRAKGVTIVVTDIPDAVGTIEILTPANGKVRKLKNTSKNQALVGSNASLSSYTIRDTSELDFEDLGKQSYNGSSCHLLRVFEKDNAQGEYAEFYIADTDFRILQIIQKDKNGKVQSATSFSNFQPIEGAKGKLQPRTIRTTDNKGKVTQLKVHSVSFRPDLTEADFAL